MIRCKPANGKSRGSTVEVPKEALNQAAHLALARYKASGLIKDGDTIVPELIKKLKAHAV